MMQKIPVPVLLKSTRDWWSRMVETITSFLIIIASLIFILAPAAPDEMMVCEECEKPFAESYLHSKFGLDVCEKCRYFEHRAHMTAIAHSETSGYIMGYSTQKQPSSL